MVYFYDDPHFERRLSFLTCLQDTRGRQSAATGALSVALENSRQDQECLCFSALKIDG